MSDEYKIDYNPNTNITDKTIMGTTDSHQASVMLSLGRMPNTLLDISAKSVSYRDAILGNISGQSETQKTSTLGILTMALETCPDLDPNLAPYSEYAAAVALMLDKKDVAAKIILRNRKSSATSFLNTLAQVITRGIEASAFSSMVQAAGETAVQKWTTVDRPALYPNG